MTEELEPNNIASPAIRFSYRSCHCYVTRQVACATSLMIYKVFVLTTRKQLTTMVVWRCMYMYSPFMPGVWRCVHLGGGDAGVAW